MQAGEGWRLVRDDDIISDKMMFLPQDTPYGDWRPTGWLPEMIGKTIAQWKIEYPHEVSQYFLRIPVEKLAFWSCKSPRCQGLAENEVGHACFWCGAIDD